MTSGSATLANHAVATRENHMMGSPLVPTPPHGLVKPFQSVEPGGLRQLTGTLGKELE
jgi:hypothetical protein